MPLHRITGRQSSGLLRLRWIPCIAALVGILFITAICFNVLGGMGDVFVPFLARDQSLATPANKPAEWNGWEGQEKLFVLYGSLSTVTMRLC